MTSKGMNIDVGGWLRRLGLGHYEAAFRESEIDEKVRTSLTQNDLKEIGTSLSVSTVSCSMSSHCRAHAVSVTRMASGWTARSHGRWLTSNADKEEGR